jgi:hypothetical protein
VLKLLVYATLLSLLVSSRSVSGEPISEMPPDAADFDLSDLKEFAEKQKAAWGDYQRRMRAAHQETQAFAQSQEDQKLIDLAWERFRNSFSANNPFTDEDEMLRETTKFKSKNSVENPAGPDKALEPVSENDDASTDQEPISRKEKDEFEVFVTDKGDARETIDIDKEKQVDIFTPAYFLDDGRSLKDRIRFPKMEDDTYISINCEAVVTRKGYMRSNYCFSKNVDDRKYERAIHRAARKARLKPAIVNGETKPILFQYAVLFKATNGNKEVFVFPHQFHSVKDYGLNYIGPQRYADSERRLVFFEGLGNCHDLWVTAVIGVEGRIKNMSAIKDPKTNCKAGMAEIRRSKFIPAVHDGNLVEARIVSSVQAFYLVRNI